MQILVYFIESVFPLPLPSLPSSPFPSPSLSFLKKHWFILFEGESEEEGDRDLPFAGLLPKWPEQPGLDQIKTRNLEIHALLLGGWQRPKVEPFPVLSQVH